ncbi:hypothetical protein [Dawidia soli]|uniref:Uncharacterized protein n=1 Tax=Dawidia soli TaxID=2782352 RepID=A0AAP2DAT1_9BACT|nr:hypothetical protein [Dawidia soli]MBT1688112.1 hypothetical protein [Dawidia soli]
MYKILLCFLFWLPIATCNAQKLGQYELNITGTYSPNSSVYEEWLKDDRIYTMRFQRNPMGFKHAMEEVQRILKQNDMTNADPEFDKSSQGSDITDEDDPEQWHNSIMKGNSEVRIGFLFPGGQLLQILMTQESYELHLLGLQR